MNRLAIVIGTLGLAAGVATAQNTTPQNPPPTDTPPTSSSTPPTSTDRSMNQSGQASSTGTPTDFDSLDRMHQGYVKRADVSGDTWLTKNFSTCDKNSDGQVSRSEYSACASRR
ncbi:hypothetical protein [Dokdonella fugitiva]|jgi:hypothetical protein|uniref:hypothetical protein n=1 Tax=Dokdonella fugitiva TaxID=328517 RepID=UPI0015FD69A4|nr:hypothetical protein [Dokdonella fugitiva]MBA8883322.1 hypothetical protein [Dokdonella fugitiva]